MRIAVCIKQVPVLAALSFDKESKTLKRAGVPAEVSAFDVRALLKAIALRNELGGEVVVITMGPPQAREALDHCCALGADSSIHLCDPAFGGADTLATAHALAAALAPHRFDLILCGRSSIDAETGQVGPELAELLGWPQVTCARTIEIEPTTRILRAQREIDGGTEVVETTLPCVVTAAEDLAAERFPSKAERAAARSKPYVLVGASDLSPHLGRFGRAGSPTWVTELEEIAVHRLGRMIAAENATASAAALAQVLVSEHGLFGEWRVPTAATAFGSIDRERVAVGGEGSGPVWVIAEEHGGELRRVSLELLQRGRQLADALATECAVVLFSRTPDKHAALLAQHGASFVLAGASETLFPLDVEPCAELLAGAIARDHPAIVLAPATGFGRDLMPRVAARLDLGLTGDCIDVGLDGDANLIQYKPAFGGNIVAPILSRTRPQMATLRAGMLPVGEPRLAAPACRVSELLDSSTSERRVRIVSSSSEAEAATGLDSADIVVGIGKGIGARENFATIEPLIDLLGAAICTTRDVTDAGWLPKQYQVGITGRTIAPKLYVAVGIRGAFEHTASIRRSGLVVAINKSPKAPIFKSADYGIVGDYAEVVPALVEALRQLRPHVR